MGKGIVRKILDAHRVYGEAKAGSPLGLRVDQVYTQDATGTMAWLQFEAIGVERVGVPLAVSYVDHNMMQSNFMNADDHAFLESAARKFGAYFSRPGNGISHQVHLERFSAPGRIALGTDSHTPTGGGIGMMSIGVGGLDAATVMAGAPFELNVPEVMLVRLTGRLRRPWVTAMDVILELLRRLTVKGGAGYIIEYGGPGVKDLSVTERATIANMGAELGATTSIFPSDERTRFYLKAQGREGDWMELSADEDADYGRVMDIDLLGLEPLIAQPHSPDNVAPARELAGKVVNQVCIGGCTNSSYHIMRQVASVLRGRTVAEGVGLLINPGSKQVYETLSRDGYITDMAASGARMLEVSCGPCIGMGGTPGTGHVSVRTYNRNFKGRSGSKDAFVYLANPLVSALFALRGEIVDPMTSDIKVEELEEPEKYLINDNMLIPPMADTSGVEVVKGPNIKEAPVKAPLSGDIEAEVLLRLGDNITTDDIMPAGSQILPLRSNIPAISEYVFSGIDGNFSRRAKAAGRFIIVGGDNYGQGSSREHAAMAPMYLGLEAVIARSFARIHRSNLINFGVQPLVFKNPEDYDRVEQGDRLLIKGAREGLSGVFLVENLNKGFTFEAAGNFNEREAEIISEGGLLPYTKKHSS
ncbi:MAG: aconitate hydratase [Thermodesulfovibrionales bacterium]|nr:aconitate hydratase [Thermodesulfovibrionales bacterium]